MSRAPLCVLLALACLAGSARAVMSLQGCRDFLEGFNIAETPLSVQLQLQSCSQGSSDSCCEALRLMFEDPSPLHGCFCHKGFEDSVIRKVLQNPIGMLTSFYEQGQGFVIPIFQASLTQCGIATYAGAQEECAELLGRGR